MKLIVLLLVCVAATAYSAEVGPLNHIVAQVEQHVQAAIHDYKDKVLALLQQHKPQLNALLATVSQFMGQLPQLESQLVQKIKDTLTQLVQTVLNGHARSLAAVQSQIAQQVQQALQQFQAQLQAIAQNILGHLGGARLDLGQLADLINVDGILNQLQQQITSTLQGLLGSLLTGKRGLNDMLVNALGLGQVWETISGLGNNLVQQFQAVATQLLFAGKDLLAQAQKILQKLIADLTSHAGDATTIVAQAIASLNQLLANNTGRRDLTSFLMDKLGLAAVWETIQNLGASVVNQFLAAGVQLLFAGTELVNQAKIIFNQLIQDLTSHAGDAGKYVQQALAQLNTLLGSGAGKRDLVDFLFNTLGLTDVWTTIKDLGSNAVSQFTTIATQLAVAGKQVLAEAKKIFGQLVADLTSHTGDAATIVAQAIASLNQLLANNAGKRDLFDLVLNQLGFGQIFDTIKELGGNFIAQFKAIAAQLLSASKQVLQQAQAIFAQLIKDLTSHTGDAATIVAQAIASLNQLLAGNTGKRGVVDNIIGSLGLDQVWSTIQSLGANVVSQFITVGTQLLLASKQLLDQAKPILSQLVSDLVNHVGNAKDIVAQALGQLTQLVAGAGKRDVLDFFVNTLGLGPVWDEITGLGGKVVAQLTALFTQLLFAGQQVLAQAKPILNQLVSDLTNHVGNASTIVSQAIASLTQVLANGAGKRDLMDFFFNTLGIKDIWTQLQGAGQSAVNQLMAIGAQLLFAGQQVLNNAKPIFQQLVQDINNHVASVPTIVSGAISQLNALLSQAGKRDLSNFLLNTLGLGGVAAQLQEAGANLLAQFTSQLTQLLFAGQQILAQAKPILNQLIQDLTNHVGSASSILGNAISQLSQVLAGKRDLTSTIVNALGLNQVWSTIQQLGGNLKDQLMAIGAQLLFSGQQVLAQAKPILAQLVQDLTSHFGNAPAIVQQAIASLTAVLAGTGKRDFTDFFLNTLGLSQVWQEISSLGSQVVGQFTAIFKQLLFAGTTALNNAKPIFAQMVSDLTNHVGNASTIVGNAIQQLTQVLAGTGKRDLLDFFLNNLGLSQVWKEIQGISGQVFSQFQAILTQLMFAGQQVLANARPILSQLVSDLTNHVGNAQTIVIQAINQLSQVLTAGKRGIVETAINVLGLNQVWSTIQELGNSFVNQLLAIGTQLLFAGQQVLAQAKPILGQLVSDLTNHVGNASTIVGQAIQQLNTVLTQAGKRGVGDFILNTLGLANVWSQIQAVGSGVANQIMAIGTQLLFAGQQVLANAKPILAQLVSDLTNHVGDASTIIANAISNLNGVLAGNTGKRGVTEFIINTLGLGNVLSLIQEAGANAVNQLLAVGAQLVFAGKELLDKAKPILAQLVSDLTNHVGNASTIVAQAIAGLQQVLASAGKRGLVDTVVSALGLDQVWSTIQALGGNFVSQIISVGTQLLLAGKQVIEQAKPVLAQLVTDLKNHITDGAPYVQKAIEALKQILMNAAGKRDLVSNVVSMLGLDQVWSTIQQLGSSVVSQFMSIGTQLLFAGQQILAQAKPILSQLIQDLTSHAGNASTIVAQAVAQLNQLLGSAGKRDLPDFLINTLGLGAIWQQIQDLGKGAVEQVIAIGTKLLFAGKEIVNQAKPIFQQLVNDLLAHTGNASTIFANAIGQLNQLLAGK